MTDTSALASADPLGIGGLLVDAHRLAQLERDAPLRAALIDAAHDGLDASLRRAIEACWRVDEHRRSRTYRAHEDINDVMLATSLAPDGFLARGMRDAA